MTEEERDQLARTWRDAPGLWGFLTTVDHKRIAARYVLTTIAMMFLAGMLALDMRLQLIKPGMERMGPQEYNESFSLHGSTMLFLVSVPVMEAMGLWLVPLMLGQRNVAFPRLSAFSYWLYLGGVLMLWVPHALGITPDLGWFEYPPLSGPAYSPGHRADIWAQMITFTEVAALAASVNLAATILKMRPPGMTLARMPLFLWAMLVASLMTILALPAVMLVTSMLIADRLVSTAFFAPVAGGDTLLFQHLFWFSAIPKSTSSSSRLSASSPRSCPPSRADHFSATAPWSSPLLRSPFWPLACGCITCSRSACRPSATPSTQPPAWPSHCLQVCRSSAGLPPSGAGARASTHPCFGLRDF
jgi:cytochrome c oxidase subunit 1